MEFFEKNCEECGGFMEVENSWKKICSEKCRKDRHRRINRKWMRQKRKGNLPEKKCDVCGCKLDSRHKKYCDDCNNW